MAEAVEAHAIHAECQPLGPIRFEAQHVSQLCRLWGSWRRLTQLETAELVPGADDSGDDDNQPSSSTAPPTSAPAAHSPAPMRMMAVWVLPAGVPAEALPGDCIVQPVGGGASAAVLVHQGSRPLSLAEDDSFGTPSFQQPTPAELRLVVWQGTEPAAILVLNGSIGANGFVVTAASSPPTYKALCDSLADAAISPGRVVPRNAQEHDAILQLATMLGRSAG